MHINVLIYNVPRPIPLTIPSAPPLLPSSKGRVTRPVIPSDNGDNNDDNLFIILTLGLWGMEL